MWHSYIEQLCIPSLFQLVPRYFCVMFSSWLHEAVPAGWLYSKIYIFIDETVPVLWLYSKIHIFFINILDSCHIMPWSIIYSKFNETIIVHDIVVSVAVSEP